MTTAQRGATCPSSSCTPGNLLIGIVRPDGTVAGLRPPLEVDAGFVERATADGLRSPESRFRFAGPCVTSACRYWSGSQCGLGLALAESTAARTDDALVPCAIRPSCRWWSQSGAAACRACPSVVHTPSLPNIHNPAEGRSS